MSSLYKRIEYGGDDTCIERDDGDNVTDDTDANLLYIIIVHYGVLR